MSVASAMDMGAAQSPLLPRRLDPLTLPPAVNWPDDNEHLTWIYGLSDPRDGALAIIGRTTRPEAAASFGDMWRNGPPSDPSPREEWLLDLASVYRFPVTHLLACVPDDWAEDHKRLYVEAAYDMDAPLLTPRVRHRWLGSWDAASIIQRGARWVLARAYPSLRGPGIDACPPDYDAAIDARLRRPPLTPAQWRGTKEKQHRAEWEREREREETDRYLTWFRTTHATEPEP